MKTKFLLFYGYILPVLTSFAVSALLALLKFDYSEIAYYYSTKQELLIAFFAAAAAIAFPFQNSIIKEDNKHVLAILRQTKVREVFLLASTLQAILIVGMLLLILILSGLKTQNYLIGWIQMFASSLIAFETMALVSNGRAYTDIREKIIVEVNKAEGQKN